MKMRRNFLCGILATALMMSNLAMTFAAAPGTLLTAEKSGDELILYVQNPGEIEEMTGQIGTIPCEEITYAPIAETEEPIRTLLLVDNSLSTTEAYRPMIREMIEHLIQNRAEGELLSIATFSESISYLVQDSDDEAELQKSLDSITYAHQNTHLTDVLYELLSEWSSEDTQGYRRIVLFSDGLDNKTIGYTKEELHALLQAHPYPIYTIGCADANEETAEGLENMFALSRKTEAAHWLFADIQAPMDVVQEITQGNDVIRIAIKAPASVSDGTQKGMKVSIKTAKGTTELSTVMEMPFAALAEDEADAAQDTNILPYICIGVLVVGIVVGVILFLKLRKRKEEELRFQTAPQGAAPKLKAEEEKWQDEAKTELFTEDLPDAAGETVMIWALQQLILTDRNNQNHRFEIPLNETALIGRGRDTGCTVILDYDASVSRRPHCQIRMVNGRVLVKDMNSSNGTYRNGMRLETETEIFDGDILKIGKVEMKVELH